MSTASPGPLVARASHGALSLTAGFVAGLALFLAIGASPTDAGVSAASLAALVALVRTLTRGLHPS